MRFMACARASEFIAGSFVDKWAADRMAVTSTAGIIVMAASACLDLRDFQEVVIRALVGIMTAQAWTGVIVDIYMGAVLNPDLLVLMAALANDLFRGFEQAFCPGMDTMTIGAIFHVGRFYLMAIDLMVDVARDTCDSHIFCAHLGCPR